MNIIEKNCQEYINFPEKGNIYRDVLQLTLNTQDRNKVFDIISNVYKNKIHAVSSSNSYLYSLLANYLDVPFIPIIERKGEKPNTIFKYYENNNKFYGIEIQMELINNLPKNCTILLVEDCISKGKSQVAFAELLEKVGCNVIILALIELLGLEGRSRLKKYNLCSFYKIPYDISKNDYYKKILENDEFALKYKTLELEYLSLDRPKIIDSNFDNQKDLILNNSIEHFNYQYWCTEDDDRIILFYHYDMESIAANIAETYPNNFRLGKINWNYFPDNWYNITFETPLNNKNVVFLGSLFDPRKFLETAMLGIIFPRQHIKSFNFVIPYFAPATFERVQKEGILASAEPVAKLLTSCLRDTKGESCVLKIYDIHALPVRFYFNDTCIIKHLTAIPLIKNIIKKNMLTVCFADEGAVKRFKHFFNEFPMIICSKERKDNERKIIISDKYNFNNEKNMDHVIIIDDLVQSGNTLHECRKALQLYGFKKVSCYVTHAVFPNECYIDFTNNNSKSGFENFYVTNTNPIVTNKLNMKPFTVLNISDHLAQDILNDLQIEKNNDFSPLDILVSCTVQNKLDAINIALNKINAKRKNKFYPVNIKGYDINNNINEQLFSYDETWHRANNKLLQLEHLIEHKSNTILISIENGFCVNNDDEKYIGYNFSVIMVKYFDKILHDTSQKIFIDIKDKDVIDYCLQNKNIKIGTKLEEKYGYPSGLWHEYYSDLDITHHISTSLTSLLSHLLC